MTQLFYQINGQIPLTDILELPIYNYQSKYTQNYHAIFNFSQIDNIKYKQLIIKLEVENYYFFKQEPILVLTQANLKEQPQLLTQQLQFMHDLNNTKYFTDYIGYAQQSKCHFLMVPQNLLSNGTWHLFLFTKPQYQEQVYINLNIFREQDDYCPLTCQFMDNESPYCYDQQSIANKQGCQCCEGFFGRFCANSAKKIVVNMMYEVHVSGYNWHNFALDIKEFDAQYSLNTSGITVRSYASIIMDGFSQYSDPNFVTDKYLLNDYQWITIDKEILQKYQNFCKDRNRYPLIFISFYLEYTSVMQFQFSIMLKRDSYVDGIPNPILLITIGFISVIVFCLISVGLYYRQHRQQQQILPEITNLQLRQQRLRMKRKQLTQKQINKYMPPMPYKDLVSEISKFSEFKECIICLINFEPEEQCRRTLCFHIFHKECLDSWFQKHLNCPFCRQSLDLNVLISDESTKQVMNKNPFVQIMSGFTSRGDSEAPFSIQEQNLNSENKQKAIITESNTSRMKVDKDNISENTLHSEQKRQRFELVTEEMLKTEQKQAIINKQLNFNEDDLSIKKLEKLEFDNKYQETGDDASSPASVTKRKLLTNRQNSRRKNKSPIQLQRVYNNNNSMNSSFGHYIRNNQNQSTIENPNQKYEEQINNQNQNNSLQDIRAQSAQIQSTLQDFDTNYNTNPSQQIIDLTPNSKLVNHRKSSSTTNFLINKNIENKHIQKRQVVEEEKNNSSDDVQEEDKQNE